MRLSTAIAIYLSTFVASSPVPNPSLLSRQLANPSTAPYVTSYTHISMAWDDSLLIPTNFNYNPNGCSYTISFDRDTQDEKYNLGVETIYGGADGYATEEKTPATYGYVGEPGADGRQTYEAVVTNACNSYSGSRPRNFFIYFIPKPGMGTDGYYY